MKCVSCENIITANTKSGLCSKCRKRRNQANWRHANPEQDQKNTKRYRSTHPEKAKEIRTSYIQNHLENVRKNKAKYQSFRMKTDVQFRLKQLLRTRLNAACKNKSGSAVDELGCSVEELKKYLESKFEPGMSWDNHGQGPGFWQIDHIKPLYKFDLTDLTQLQYASHFSNLRPLWYEEHIKKTIIENIDAKT